MTDKQATDWINANAPADLRWWIHDRLRSLASAHCSASCRTCKHWCEQNEGFGTCANAANRELLRVLGGYMLCNAAYGCVLHEPNDKDQAQPKNHNQPPNT